MSRYCLRSTLIAALMGLLLPWLFWPDGVAQDPSAYAILLGAWLAALGIFGVLARTPGQWTWLREFCIGLFIAVAVLWGADHLPMVRRYGDHALIFQPGTTARYESVEYHITATANNLGFRDRDFNIERTPGTHRVLVIGDSFVYGWGIAQDACWPKTLEKALPPPVEVANLGQPGASPFQYANLADRVVPLLRPDVVVVGISESNDLWQSVPEESPTVFRSFLRKPLNTLFPNLAAMLYQRRHPHEDKDVHDVWVQEASTLLAQADAAGLARFSALDADVQKAYRMGEVNPSELQSVLRNPTDLTVFPPGDPVTALESHHLAGQLKRIARTCARQGCPLLVVGIPAAVCVNGPAFAGQQRAGFQLDPKLLGFDGHDQAVRAAAAEAQVSFWSAFPDFYALKDRAGLFFSLDNHLAPDGDALLGRLVAAQVEPLLRGH